MRLVGKVFLEKRQREELRRRLEASAARMEGRFGALPASSNLRGIAVAQALALTLPRGGFVGGGSR